MAYVFKVSGSDLHRYNILRTDLRSTHSPTKHFVYQIRVTAVFTYPFTLISFILLLCIGTCGVHAALEVSGRCECMYYMVEVKLIAYFIYICCIIFSFLN